MKPQNDNPAKPEGFDITLRLTAGECRATQTIARKHFRIPFQMEFTAESLVALHAVQFALTRPDEFSKFIFRLADYQHAEGLDMISHGQAMVENHPFYKKKRMPKEFLPRVV